MYIYVYQTKMNKMGGHEALLEKKRGSYWGLVGKPEGTRPRGKPWRR
jgi:hypothetical protein